MGKSKDRQTKRQTYFFAFELEVVIKRENMKVSSQPMASIAILPLVYALEVTFFFTRRINKIRNRIK